MRVLFVAPVPSPLSRELAHLGHDVRVIPASARRCLHECALFRPDVAYLQTWSARVPPILLALRVPYVVEVDRPAEVDPRSALIARAARAVVAFSDEAGRFAVDGLGAREASIIPPGIELDPLSLRDREEAKRALNLQPGLRMVLLLSRLDADLRLDLLAEAHRKLSGTALLVIGDGAGAPFVQAMRAATRPSSPVLFLGSRPREEEILAIRAAHACVSLRGPLADYAACGRRQVALEHDERIESLYPPESRAVRIAEPSPLALRAMLEEMIEAPELGSEVIEQAREQLSWAHAARQVAQVLAG